MKKFIEEKRKKELVSSILQKFEKRRRERLKYELQWRLNINFFLGDQYCDILPEAQKLISSEKAFSWQERGTFNHIAPIIESRLAKLNKLVPRVLVRPATADEEDVVAAQVSTKILSAAFERNNMKSIIREGTMWSELCGTVFYKQDWVNVRGEFLGVDEQGLSVYQGDVACTVCPPQEIYPDSDTRQNIEECDWVIHARVYPCKYINEMFGIEVAPQKVETLSVFGKTENKSDDSALLVEYYENPSEEFEKGRYIVLCGDKLLFEGELPYQNGISASRKIPFVQQNCITRPGTIWGVSIVERCIPIQRAYNAVRNRKHEFLNRAAVGILTCEEGTVDLEDLEENGLTPGKVIVYRQGASAPQMMFPGSLPNEFLHEENALLEEFNLISGTSDLMRQSVAPTNVTSGVALNTIAEQDDTRISITADKVRDAMLEISRQWIRIFRQFASQKRIDRIVGKNGEISAVCWSANMLTSDDVIHETENELSNSVASRKQMIFDLLSRGMFEDEHGKMSEHTRARVLRALGVGDWENIADIDEINLSRAQRENIMLKNGQSPTLLEVDDHEMHIAEHSKTLLSEEFEKEYGLASSVREKIEEHIIEHKLKKEAQTRGEGNA